jgi:molybdate/tungstate transport system substrate-binding protein
MMMNKPIPGMPGVNYSSWYIIFSLNEMIIAYKASNNPPYLNNITSKETPWYAILNRTDVTFGRADPWQDPCGYRTLMVWGLADHFYNLSHVQDPQDINQSFYNKDPLMSYSGPGHTVVKAKEVDMISSLEAGEIDYLFIYRSVAIQHNFGFIELDDHMNLANVTLESYYNTVKVHRISPLVPGQSSSDVKAETIQYGLTIPNNAPHPEDAIVYVKFMLGYPGLLMEMGQPPYFPAFASNVSKLPAALQPYCVQYPYA